MEEETVTQTINITQVVLDTINSLCESLFSSINKSIFPELDKLIFLDEDLTNSTYMERIIGTDFNTGLLVLAEFFLSAFVLYYAIRRFTSYYSGQSIESASKFFIKAIVIGIFVFSSFSICSSILSATSEITTFVCSLGKNIFKQEISFSNLIDKLNTSSSNEKFNLFSFNGILTSMISISSFSLILSFSIRYILTKVLILFSPFAFLCLINKPTSSLFKCWIKSFFSLLLIQIMMSFILLLSFAIIKENSSNIFNQILLIGSSLALMKSSQFVREFLNNTGISTDFSSGISRYAFYIYEVIMDKYIFPLNYKYSAKFLGIIEYNILLPIMCIVSVVGFFLYIGKVDFFISAGIIIFLALPPLLILSIGINGQPAIPYFKSILIYSKRKKIYVYGKTRDKQNIVT